MLYDPKWDQWTLLDKWIDFAASKPADEQYQWDDEKKCVNGQFYGGGGWRTYPDFQILDSIAQGGGYRGLKGNWTFGKCVERAKQYREWHHLGYLVNANAG